MSHPHRTSSSPNDSLAARPWYRAEPWLALCLGAFIPTLAGVFAPEGLRIPVLVVAGAMLVAGLALLFRAGASRPHDADASPPHHAPER